MTIWHHSKKHRRVGLFWLLSEDEIGTLKGKARRSRGRFWIGPGRWPLQAESLSLSSTGLWSIVADDFGRRRGGWELGAEAGVGAHPGRGVAVGGGLEDEFGALDVEAEEGVFEEGFAVVDPAIGVNVDAGDAVEGQLDGGGVFPLSLDEEAGGGALGVEHVQLGADIGVVEEVEFLDDAVVEAHHAIEEGIEIFDGGDQARLHGWEDTELDGLVGGRGGHEFVGSGCFTFPSVCGGCGIGRGLLRFEFRSARLQETWVLAGGV